MSATETGLPNAFRACSELNTSDDTNKTAIYAAHSMSLNLEELSKPHDAGSKDQERPAMLMFTRFSPFTLATPNFTV